jgi:hypothetical protein
MLEARSMARLISAAILILGLGGCAAVVIGGAAYGVHALSDTASEAADRSACDPGARKNSRDAGETNCARTKKPTGRGLAETPDVKRMPNYKESDPTLPTLIGIPLR